MTHQGTGFFAKAPEGAVVGITSAHFLKFDGPPLEEVHWLSVRTDKPVTSFTKSWGPPGNAGTTTPKADLRSDYLIMPVEEKPPVEHVLDLDPRSLPDVGERVWFPDKTPELSVGYRLYDGIVGSVEEGFIGVVLKELVKLQSQSGSPIISQKTGKVIGTLSRGLDNKGKTILLLTPTKGIAEALYKHNTHPPLRDVVGKRP